MLLYADCKSACPLQAEDPIEAAGFMPVSSLDITDVPDLTLTIP